ncbi:hypothetical protein D3C71_1755140 [compost metagenome]
MIARIVEDFIPNHFGFETGHSDFLADGFPVLRPRRQPQLRSHFRIITERTDLLLDFLQAPGIVDQLCYFARIDDWHFEIHRCIFPSHLAGFWYLSIHNQPTVIHIAF